MKNKLLPFLLLCCISFSSYAQWQQSAGTADLNMQSLLTNGNYNFAGGATGAYLSTDGAANYLSSNIGNDATGPTRGFAKDNTYIYTCTSQGAFRSSDNGATWVSKSSGLTNLLGSGILKVGSRLFYVGPSGVFVSSDQGDNWNAAGLSATDVRSIAAIDDNLFVGTNGFGIYKSTDWGLTWVAVNNGLGAAANFRAIESKGNTLFAAGPTGTGVFRSTDFGANWTLLSGGLSSGSYRGFASNSRIIVAGSFGGGVFYSTDNGDNWTAINSGLADLTIFDLELSDNHIIAATNTRGVFRFALSNLVSGIDEPSLSQYALPEPNPANASCPSGFFSVIVDDGPGAGLTSGAYGMEVLLEEPGTGVLAGGLNFGGLIDIGQVGFAGFTIANAANEAQRLYLSLTGSPSTSSTASLPVRIRIGRRPDANTNVTMFETTQTISLAGPYVTSIDLPPAFYEVTVAPTSGSAGGAPEGQFYFSLTTSFTNRPGGGFQGGAVVGGYHAAHPFGGVSGFAGFCLATPHSTSIRVLSQPSYGPTGAKDLRLRIQDAQQRNVVVVPAG